MIGSIMSSMLYEPRKPAASSFSRRDKFGNSSKRSPQPSMEFLDLLSEKEISTHTHGFSERRRQDEAELYSFEDYWPETGNSIDALYDGLVEQLRQHDGPEPSSTKQKSSRTRSKSSVTPPLVFVTEDKEVSEVFNSDEYAAPEFRGRLQTAPGYLADTARFRAGRTKKICKRSRLHPSSRPQSYCDDDGGITNLCFEDNEDHFNSEQRTHRVHCREDENTAAWDKNNSQYTLERPHVTFDMDFDQRESCQSLPMRLETNSTPTDTRKDMLMDDIVKIVNEDVLQRKPEIRRAQTSHNVITNKRHSLQSSKSQPALNLPQTESPSNSGHMKRLTLRRRSVVTSIPAELLENKKNDKKTKQYKEPLALFEAVEQGDLEKVNQILNTECVNINGVNDGGLTALDIAILSNHSPITQTLLQHGAKCKLLDHISEHELVTSLQTLVQQAQHQVSSLSAKVSSSSGSSLKESERKLNQWEYKHRLFRRMKNGYEQAGTPGEPRNVKLTVASDRSLLVRYDSPDAINGAVVTRYKVEWSKSQTFKPLAGEALLYDNNHSQYEITALERGAPYYVKVTAWNVKGFGRSAISDPPCATPSSWADAELNEHRRDCFDSTKLHDILSSVRRIRNGNDEPRSQNNSPLSQRKNSISVRRGFSRLFSSAVKFQKSLKRGVYMACVYYNEDKVLVTSEDHLPLLEVEETFNSGTVQSDFDWLMKVAASSWENIKSLNQELGKLPALSGSHLRSQLLSAVLQLQNVTGMQNLGRLFYKPVRDPSGSIVFVLVNRISDPKLINQMASVKWQTSAKLLKSGSNNDSLLGKLSEIMFFNDSSTQKPDSGLYLGYLNIKLNVDSIRVVVPDYQPNVLPYVKIRDCPNVSLPEWESLLNIAVENTAELNSPSVEVDEFKTQVMDAARKLTENLELNEEQISEHKIYDVELLEFSKDISFLMLIPPRDLVCSIQNPSQTENGSTESVAGYVDMPVKAFEMIHLQTFQQEFMTNYARAACTVDVELLLAQQSHREAFNSEEVEKAKQHLESIKSYQHQLEEIWRSTRWLTDVITFARNKSNQGVRVCQLTSPPEPATEIHSKISDDGYHSDKISLSGSVNSDKLQLGTSNTNNNNARLYQECEQEASCSKSRGHQQEKLAPGILRVYAAYDCGLARGTSVLLHVTGRSTAKEIINLVVMQLNQAILSKGYTNPIFSERQLDDFCLVAVIGPRERVLRSDYRLLQLQNPWTKGRLYVRMKDNLLAALEQGEITEV